MHVRMNIALKTPMLHHRDRRRGLKVGIKMDSKFYTIKCKDQTELESGPIFIYFLLKII
jgi:hypothetical protein